MFIPNIQTIDLSTIRHDRCTSDVKFRFETAGGVKLELPAHKLVLACASDVFRAQFYGELKEKKAIIDVVDASYDAFKVLVDIVYNIAVPLEMLSYEILEEVYNLAHKFIMVALQDLIIGELVSRIYDRKLKLLDVAKLAERTAHLEKFSDALYEAGTAVVREDVESVFELFDDKNGDDDSSKTVCKLLAKGNKVEGKEKLFCINCMNSKCLHGEVLTKENLVVNANIRYKGYKDWYEGKALEVRHKVTVHYLTEGKSKSDGPQTAVTYKCK